MWTNAAVVSRRRQLAHGCLPNVIYQRIINFSDAKTHRACLYVSRAFHSYALDYLHLGGDIEICASAQNTLRMYHPSTGFLRTIPPEPPESSHNHSYFHRKEWHPLVGESDGSSSLPRGCGILVRNFPGLPDLNKNRQCSYGPPEEETQGLIRDHLRAIDRASPSLDSVQSESIQSLEKKFDFHMFGKLVTNIKECKMV